MELARAQPKLFDTEQARGRKLQSEKIPFKIRGHASTRSSALSFLIQLFCFYFTFLCIPNPLPSRAYCRRYALQVIYCGYRNLIRVFSNVSLQRSDRFRLFTASECALRTAHAFTALSQSGDRASWLVTFVYRYRPSDKRPYWLKWTSLRNTASRYRLWKCWAFL